ncbi:MAG TPA: peroxiredoxin [Ferrovibrio sp.]|jgi:peroxiredoxin Q/BCP|uniref:peroxiredoxin n=1 Tax=Ferrovibrio sp. TaxID=1917215 RepID=UPI002B4B091B|nr:peroxiredoxin [Ferrovibrio sp.]HLT77405.1 peroxiredoxin [Ferrovibrio sp.]
MSKSSKSKELEVGDKAPAFTLPTDGGGKVSLSELKGKPVVLYFYPKDDTTGCTKEALDFSAAKAKFDRLGAVVIGCSRDSVASHDKFKTKHKLKLTLAADETGKVTDSYGVWVEKSLYGRKYMGIERATFLIGPDGRIAAIWRKVKVPGHVDSVLKAIQALRESRACHAYPHPVDNRRDIP